MSLAAAKKAKGKRRENQRGETALHAACRGGHVDVVDVLLKAGADPSSTDSLGRTPLHVAARGGFLDVVKALLAGNADIGARDAHNIAPMHVALEAKQMDVASFLYQRNAPTCGSSCTKCRLGKRLVARRLEKEEEARRKALEAKRLRTEREKTEDVLQQEFGDVDLFAEIERMKAEFGTASFGNDSSGGGSSSSGVGLQLPEDDVDHAFVSSFSSARLSASSDQQQREQQAMADQKKKQKNLDASNSHQSQPTDRTTEAMVDMLNMDVHDTTPYQPQQQKPVKKAKRRKNNNKKKKKRGRKK